MLKVLSDILLAIDAVDISALALLDLSAAFDTGGPRHPDSATEYFLWSVSFRAAVVPDILDQPALVCLNRILGVISDTDHV